MPWRGASYRGEFPSLGWAVSDWITDNLLVPDGPHAGEPLVLTDEQVGIVVRFYRIHPTTGAPHYRRAALVRSKGWGKSPLLGALALAEACGPVRFDHWDDAGEPAGRQVDTPWVQIAAVSVDQTDNTFKAILGMLGATDPDGEPAPIVARYGLDVGITRIGIPHGEVIEPVTSSAGTREGQRVTFAVLDETHLWIPSNHGPELAAVLRRNTAKMGGLTFESTNAWVPGQESVAEKTADAGKARSPGVLFDHRKNPKRVSLTNKRELRRGLTYVYGDSGTGKGGWVDIGRLMADIADPDTTVDDAYRFYLNDETVRSDAWVDPKIWKAQARPVAPEPQEAITAGFVGLAYSGAALIGCRVDSGEIFTVATWETDHEMVSRAEVTAQVDAIMAGYIVRRFYVDPREWGDSFDAWALAYGECVVSFGTHRPLAMGAAVDRFRTAVGAHLLHHDDDPVLTRHVERARRKTTTTGTLITARTDSPADQITAAKAAVLAYEARADVIAEGPDEPPAWGPSSPTEDRTIYQRQPLNI
ncbi:MAG: hypothetical protein QOG43_2907 [Actinomycetota bacterium]|nr:hypothetical protein [Actinomycetota bacterium]